MPTSSGLGGIRTGTLNRVVVPIAPPLADTHVIERPSSSGASPSREAFYRMVSIATCILLVLSGITVGVWAALND